MAMRRQIADSFQPRGRFRSRRPGITITGAPESTSYSYRALMAAALAKNLRGRLSSLGERWAAAQRLAELWEGVVERRQEAADHARDQLESLQKRVEEVAWGLLEPTTATDSFLYVLAIVTEVGTGLVVASNAFDLEIQNPFAGVRQLVETLEALSVAGGLALGFNFVGHKLARLSRRVDQARWAEAEQPQLCKEVDELSISSNTLRGRWTLRVFALLLIAATVAARATPVLASVTARFDTMRVGLALLSGLLAVAPMAVGYALGHQHGPVAVKLNKLEAAANRKQRQADRAAKEAAEWSGKATALKHAHTSEQEATRAEQAGLGANGASQTISAGGETPDVVASAEKRFPEADFSMEPPTIPDLPETGPRWTPRVIKGGRVPGAGDDSDDPEANSDDGDRGGPA